VYKCIKNDLTFQIEKGFSWTCTSIKTAAISLCILESSWNLVCIRMLYIMENFGIKLCIKYFEGLLLF
jgi:hypothetical protein